MASREVHHLMRKSREFSTFVSRSLRRHELVDRGDCCPEDEQANERALNGS